jgi:FkbM family methyltransferase
MKKFITQTNIPHEKLGTKYGIGVIPENFLNSESVCYCAGAGEDISFDLELAKKFHCKIYIFDPTPRAMKHFEDLVQKTNLGELMPIGKAVPLQYYSIKSDELGLCSFYPYGLWSEDKKLKFFPPESSEFVSYSLVNLHKTQDFIEVECKKISNIMSLLGHKKVNLLKLDIVGAEYEVVDSLIAEKIFPEILLIEFDEGSLASFFNRADTDYFVRITETIRKLKSVGYIMTFVDDWNVTFILQSVIPESVKNCQ